MSLKLVYRNYLTLQLYNKPRNILITVLVLAFATIANPQIVWGSNNAIKELNKRLFSAVLSNNFALVRSTIIAGANLKTTNEEGLTPAGLAVEKGYFDIAHYILGILKQKPSTIERSTGIILEKIKKNSIHSATTIAESEKTPILTPPFKSSTPLKSKTYKKWPKNEPNPFSPTTQPNKKMPIIGITQKPPVAPVTKSQILNLKDKVQNLNSSPLNMPNISGLREAQSPTPILPLGKKVTKTTKPKKPNGLKFRKATADQEEEFEEEDLFDKVWNKINKFF